MEYVGEERGGTGTQGRTWEGKLTENVCVCVCVHELSVLHRVVVIVFVLLLLLCFSCRSILSCVCVYQES